MDEGKGKIYIYIHTYIHRKAYETTEKMNEKEKGASERKRDGK